MLKDHMQRDINNTNIYYVCATMLLKKKRFKCDIGNLQLYNYVSKLYLHPCLQIVCSSLETD